MNYGGIYHFDVLNGLGFRVSLFVSGCSKFPKCRECQNPQAWRKDYGKLFTEETKQEILDTLSHPNVRGLSLLGGEPSDNLEDGTLFNLLDEVKEKYPTKDIWAWTGYQIEDLMADITKLQFLHYLDVLVDGEFIPELKDLSRPFGNSSNQRVIDVQATLKAGEVVLWRNEK